MLSVKSGRPFKRFDALVRASSYTLDASRITDEALNGIVLFRSDLTRVKFALRYHGGIYYGKNADAMNRLINRRMDKFMADVVARIDEKRASDWRRSVIGSAFVWAYRSGFDDAKRALIDLYKGFVDDEVIEREVAVKECASVIALISKEFDSAARLAVEHYIDLLGNKEALKIFRRLNFDDSQKSKINEIWKEIVIRQKKG